MKMMKKTLAIVLALVMVLGMVPMSVFAADATSTGTTTGEPFPQGTADSNSFRIPALVTLSDGTLVAAADARWNTTYDGGGLDTIVSISTDNGDTWKYSFANYLGDNDNEYNGSTTAFIDPALAVTSDDTIYMLCDLYPYGVALNGDQDIPPVTGTGFNTNGKLLLSANNHSSYDYYLDGNTIYFSNGTAVSGLTVDAYFNVTGTYNGTTYNTNLFFSDSPFKVVRTGFLYLTKGTYDKTNKTISWSAPQLLNLKFTDNSERVCLVGPGRGLVTSSSDMIVFPVYSFNSNASEITTNQQTGFIYSTDGTNWTRSASLPTTSQVSWSSESAVVELKSGALRFFFRNGTTNLCYVDYNNGWGNPVVMNGIDTNSNCQISAITYSKTISNKQVILVSCPTGPSEAGSDQSGASYRKNGKIFAFTVEADGTLAKVGSVNVTSNDNQFMYSCLTELNDGTVGILYEDKENAWGTGSNCYYTMEYDVFNLTNTMGLTFDAASSETTVDAYFMQSGTKITELNMVAGNAAQVVTVANVATATQTVTATSNNTGVARVEVSGNALTVTPVAAGSATITVTVANNTRAATAGTYTLNVNVAASTTVENVVNVRIPVDGTSETFTDDTGNYQSTASIVDGTIANMYISGTDATDSAEKTKTEITSASFEAGKKYLIVNNRNSKAMTTTLKNGSLSWVPGSTLSGYALSGDTEEASENLYLWSIVPIGDGKYYIMQGDQYLTFTSSGVTYTANLTNTTTPLTLEYSGGVWYIENDGRWLSNVGSQGIAVGYDTKWDDGNYWTIYEVAGGTTPASTEFFFTGLKAGSTTAIVGTTQYNITVYEEVDVKINYVDGGKVVATGTVKVPSDAATTDTVSLPGTVTNGTDTYKVNSDTLILSNGTGATYDVTVTLLEGTEITIKENETQEISVTLTDGQYVEWTSADSSYVGVAGKYDAANKVYTDAGVIIGHNVTSEPVLVIGTVYNQNGTVAGTYKWLVTVTKGDADTNTSSKHIYVNVVTMEHCTVYYSVNAGELVKINGTGVLVDANVTGHYNLMFFAKPDEGYALTYMAVSGSGNQYYTLADGNPDGTGSGAWPFDDATASTIPETGDDSAWVEKHGFRWALLEGNFGIEQMKLMFSQALALGCDGATTFTKNGNDSFYTEVGFAAQKLPEFEKTIASITRTNENGNVETIPYTAGMTLGIGDRINYKLTIKIPAELQGNVLDTSSSYTVTSPITSTNKPTYKTGSYGTVQLTKGTLKDILKDTTLQLYTDASYTTEFNGTLADAESKTTEQTLTYYTYIQLTAGNFLSVVEDGKIINSADLEFTYSSIYTQGVLDKKSQAIAKILVEVPEHVIDFGLPVIIDLTNDPLVDGDKIKEATAKYGKITIDPDNPRRFTYTPTTILPGTDFITLTFYDMKLENGDTVAEGAAALIGYGVRIYPATSVYYEENFLLNKDYSGWESKDPSKVLGNQASEELGNHQNNFGYDGAYDGVTNTGYIVGGAGATTTFTFTGTGFQLFGNSSSESGVVAVRSKGGLNKLYMIDTKLTDVDGVTIKDTTYYGLPLISETKLPYGTYTVTIKQTGDNSIYLDGIRVFNTINDITEGKGNIYYADQEDRPDFYEIRDYVLNALGVEGLDKEENVSQYTDPADRVGLADSISQMAGQVYNAIAANDASAASAVIVADKNAYPATDLQKLLDNGPKNELYLYEGQTLFFKVKTNRVVQLGLKAPTGAAEFTITVNDKTLVLNGLSTLDDDEKNSLSTSVDMFYELAGNVSSSDSVREITVSIKVTSGVLSATLLKICDDPNATFPALTQEDIENAMMAMYGLNEVKADANLTVDLKDYTGKVLGSVELSANGVEGQTAVFTAAEILAAAKAQLPTKYAFVDESAVADVEVVYGQSEHTSVQIGKVATLKIKYVSMFGKTKGTATITVVQTARGYCRITASEIKAAAPAVRCVMWSMSVYLTFGRTTSITVPVF